MSPLRAIRRPLSVCLLSLASFVMSHQALASKWAAPLPASPSTFSVPPAPQAERVQRTGAPHAWRVRQADVRVNCPITIGGSFDAQTTALSGSVTANEDGSPAFDGRFEVDLRTLDTGIGLRNDHLREKYLEVGKGPGFEAATLTNIAMTGLTPDAPEGKGSFTGSLTLHGVTNAVTGSVEVRRAGAGLRVQAAFPVTLSAYSIPAPRYLGVGVKDTVQVHVDLTVMPGAPR